MSARESSEAFAGVLGPIIALVNQQLIYMANMWTCGRNMQHAAHAIPALCLIVTISLGVNSYRRWRATGGGAGDERAAEETRVRFLAMIGIALSIFSSLVIVAQWAAIFAFDPCMRA
jgi:hypothetical protein